MSLKLNQHAVWQHGFRPTKVRVIYAAANPPMWELAVGRIAGGNDYGQVHGYVSGAELDLVCTGNIERINLYGAGGSLTVSRIEFYL